MTRSKGTKVGIEISGGDLLDLFSGLGRLLMRGETQRRWHGRVEEKEKWSKSVLKNDGQREKIDRADLAGGGSNALLMTGKRKQVQGERGALLLPKRGLGKTVVRELQAPNSREKKDHSQWKRANQVGNSGGATRNCKYLDSFKKHD